MNLFELKTMSPEDKRKIMRRAETDISEYMQTAREIALDVKENGDKAVLSYTKKFDKVELKNGMRVSQEEIEAGYERLDKETREAIEYAASNIRTFHEAQMPEEIWFTNVNDGIMAGEKVTPITDVCLYVPRGKGSFPSVLLMLGIPALVAGVPKIVVVTPPNERGTLDDAMLAAAKIIGIHEIIW